MIPIGMDEAEAYDRLAILEIKLHKRPNEQLQAQQKRLWRELQVWVGEKKHLEITESPEFETLYAVNEKVFNDVDLVEQDPCNYGRPIAVGNRERWLAKDALQMRFFGHHLNEQKIGYSVEETQ